MNRLYTTPFSTLLDRSDVAFSPRRANERASYPMVSTRSGRALGARASVPVYRGEEGKARVAAKRMHLAVIVAAGKLQAAH